MGDLWIANTVLTGQRNNSCPGLTQWVGVNFHDAIKNDLQFNRYELLVFKIFVFNMFTVVKTSSRSF